MSQPTRRPPRNDVRVPTLHPDGELRILSLDGGGIRGLSILYILQELMERIRVQKDLEEQPLPCDYFDLIIGTSTGGLIALMLGRLRMSVDAAIDVYCDFAKEVFGKGAGWSGWCLPIRNPLSTKPRYSAEKLVAVFQGITKQAPLADRHPRACKTAVIAVNSSAANGAPEVLRTYQTEAGYLDCQVSDAARATTAAPTFFQPAVICIRHGFKVTYIDGGLRYNNPAELTITEAKRIWGSTCRFRCLVSIGTGISPKVNFKGNKLQLAKKLAKIMTSCNDVHEKMRNREDRSLGAYFRLNAPTDLRNIGLDEWARQQDVAGLTRDYINDDKLRFQECVKTIIYSGQRQATSVEVASLDSERITDDQDLC